MDRNIQNDGDRLVNRYGEVQGNIQSRALAQYDIGGDGYPVQINLSLFNRRILCQNNLRVLLQRQVKHYRDRIVHLNRIIDRNRGADVGLIHLDEVLVQAPDQLVGNQVFQTD